MRSGYELVLQWCCQGLKPKLGAGQWTASFPTWVNCFLLACVGLRQCWHKAATELNSSAFSSVPSYIMLSLLYQEQMQYTVMAFKIPQNEWITKQSMCLSTFGQFSRSCALPNARWRGSSLQILSTLPAIFAIKMPIMYLRTQDNGVSQVCVREGQVIELVCVCVIWSPVRKMKEVQSVHIYMHISNYASRSTRPFNWNTVLVPVYKHGREINLLYKVSPTLLQ